MSTTELPAPRVQWKPGKREEARRNVIKRVQANQIDENHVVNEVLAEYTQATSFSMNLGRTHVQALSQIARETDMWVWMALGSTSPAMRGLERRGLVMHRPPTEEEVDNPPPFGDGTRWSLTTAGKLMVMLLIEAGLLSPSMHTSELPPPPPDWVDPRPKVVI
jgi:hypothetical protein